MKKDLIVVGAGIVGLATAYRAHKRGESVMVIDAADRPVGASIMNFGHACFTGQADVIQQAAMRSRQGWQDAAADAGLWAVESGTWISAGTELELSVLEEFAEHRGGEQVQLKSRQEVAAALGTDGFDGLCGAHLPLDMRVNPREAAPKLAAWLATQGVEFVWNTQVTGARDGVVDTVRGEFVADRVVVCPGDKLAGLFPDIAERHGVRTCTLAMALLERPQRIPQELSMLTGTSLTRYDGFAAMPSVPALREEIAQNSPQLVDMVANVMATGIDAGLLVGDSHAYDLSPEPFIDEDIAQELQDQITGLLQIENPKVKQRWLGRYADSKTTNLIIESPDERTTVVVVTSGIGMTLSFGIADLALAGTPVPSF